jgi:acetate kinase
VRATPGTRVLTINGGSSSLKAAVYRMGASEDRLISLTATRIGLPQGRVRIEDELGALVLDREERLPHHEAAFRTLLGWLASHEATLRPDVAGHRVVHGGTRFRQPTPVTAELLAALETLRPLDPDHLPQAIGGIRAVAQSYPDIPQVACFDTGFHDDLPPVARSFALPRSVTEEGVLRYGFHGLSYEYVMAALRSEIGAAAEGRVVIAHLGSGASMAAIRHGRSVDTTMGFTPAGGLVMGTRSGDLDPGVLLYLMRERRLSADQLDDLINRQSGLAGVSGISGDMQDLLDREAGDPRAAEAVALFCYQAKKYLAACAAVLGGLDQLVFTAGIGEHAAPVRERICADLGFLGIELDALRNARHDPVISSEHSRVAVRIIRTNEELMVARHARRLAARGVTTHADPGI